MAEPAAPQLEPSLAPQPGAPGTASPAAKLDKPDRPWVMRTYSGHSTAEASNALYRGNLAAGQTGLSIAFDLPTQLGHDPDHPMAKGEVGKVGVPVAHIGHMRTLLDGIDPGDMNTSMTINAPAAFLLALYVANAREKGVDIGRLAGTTQNDIVKEYLSRGTYIFPPEPSSRLIVDMVAWTLTHTPKWNPINICSYHLQEAGATPAQEIAYALANAVGVLDGVRDSGQVDPDDMGAVVARISFFVNAGIRFVEEIAKMRAFTTLWDRITRERYGVEDPRQRRFRYGVQVNSLGLTEQQPENNVYRIVLEALGVLGSRDARARALQLPAWNEALGLPRPWDQQWSLRAQQILAYETDLLEYPDIFDGSHVMEAKVEELIGQATAEMEEIERLGGVFEAIETIKSRLVTSHAERTRRIESGELVVVGVNRFTETAASPLTSNDNILRVDPAVEAAQIEAIGRWRAERNQQAVDEALSRVRMAAADGSNIMGPTIDLAAAGGTVGEWADALREEFGTYRAPTGVGGANRAHDPGLSQVAARSRAMAGGPPRLLVAKPGLDGHSNGAEQIAVAARDAGFEVIYQGIRLSPAEIAEAAVDEDPDVIGLSILSGSHLELVPEVLRLVREAGVDAPVIAGGIIPAEDEQRLRDLGVSAVYTPKDFSFTRIMGEIADITEKSRAE